MAYKFQLGSAKLGGSVEAGAISGSAITGSAVDADTADRVIAAVAAGDIPSSKLAIANAKILIGDLASGHAQEFALSGDVAMTAGGVVAIQAEAVTNDMLSGSIANVKLANSTISGKSLGSNLDALTAANGISMSSFNGFAAVSDLTIQRSGSAHALKLDSDGVAVLLSGSTGLAIDDGGLKLSAVPNASLANNSVSFGTVEVALGASNDAPAFVLSAATAYPGDSSLVTAGALNAGSITIGFGAINNGASAITTIGTGSFGKVVVSGDLSVAGALTYIDTTNLRVSDAKVVFADGALALSGGQGFYIGSDAGDASEKASFAVGDGAGSNDAFVSSLALSASAFYGDGSSLQGVSATAVQMVSAKFDSASSATGSISNQRYVIADSATAAMLINLPTIAPAAAGTMIIIKRVGANNVTISSANTSQVVEGSDQDITLETDGAAVTLMATDEGDAAHGGWRIV